MLWTLLLDFSDHLRIQDCIFLHQLMEKWIKKKKNFIDLACGRWCHYRLGKEKVPNWKLGCSFSVWSLHVPFAPVWDFSRNSDFLSLHKTSKSD